MAAALATIRGVREMTDLLSFVLRHPEEYPQHLADESRTMIMRIESDPTDSDIREANALFNYLQEWLYTLNDMHEDLRYLSDTSSQYGTLSVETSNRMADREDAKALLVDFLDDAGVTVLHGPGLLVLEYFLPLTAEQVFELMHPPALAVAAPDVAASDATYG